MLNKHENTRADDRGGGGREEKKRELVAGLVGRWLPQQGGVRGAVGEAGQGRESNARSHKCTDVHSFAPVQPTNAPGGAATKRSRIKEIITFPSFCRANTR